MSLPSQVLRRLTKEIARLQRTPPEGIGIEVGEQDILDVSGWIQGPVGTPYEGGFFLVKFDFTADFPTSPPKCLMKTKIFHPNIHSSGEICVSTLKKDWSSKYGIEHILLVIKCLLITPNADSALDAEAGRLLQDAYSEYASTASIWTRIHANNCPTCLSHIIEDDSQGSVSSKVSKKIDIGESSSTMARPLEQSGSSNQAYLERESSGAFAGVVGAATPLTAPIVSIGINQKRKSDEALEVSGPISRKRKQIVPKRGIKRL